MTRTLQAQDVAFAYTPPLDVFTHVTAAVRSGEVTGLVGPNGSGKSTLLRVLAGLLRPREGKVLIDGRSSGHMSNRQRARILGFLPQLVNPVFSLSVFEVVCLGRYPHLGALGATQPHDRAVAERCLRDTETLDLRDRDFMALSGGERQRVLLASVLAQEPDLLLLDEPTSALDIHHQIEIFALLKRLAGEGYGIGVVTHDLNLAARFCNQLFLLSHRSTGLVAAGKPENVLTEALLSEAYDAPIRVCRHPLTGAPLITAEEPAEVTP
ncbi:MAG: ABC transporter ATP-binding protein [Candidatus Hydrogenedentes bacterium]|nr:ABC transporter ATP-binding protein [Candidatus Hydrogenedentota bacterium]